MYLYAYLEVCNYWYRRVYSSIAEEDISDIQESLDSNKNPVLVQLPQHIYDQVKNDWQLSDLL